MGTNRVLSLYEGGSNGRAYAEYVIKNDLYQNHKEVEEYEWDLILVVPVAWNVDTNQIRKSDSFWFEFLSHMEDENLDVAL